MYVLELDKNQLIAFAQGTTIGGVTIATANAAIVDSGPALAQILGTNGWTLLAKVMGGSHEVYTISHT